ncbi:MAG: S41 family peptidase [Phycisphaerales bacterium JB043]
MRGSTMGMLARSLPVAIIGVGIGIWIATQTSAVASRENPYKWFDPLFEVHQLVSDRFVSEPDQKELQQSAIEGMLEALHDEYTTYIPHVDIAEFNKNIRGEYVGIGSVVRYEEPYTVIVTPMDGSPSLRAGLRPGDKILEVNGQDMKGLGSQAVVDVLTGEPGTDVTITLERDGEPYEVTITRADIVTKTVAGIHRDGEQWDYLLDDESGVGYLRVTSFGAETPDEFADALDALEENDVRGLIIDLRFNPGGLLRSAILMSDMFLNDGVIVSTKGRAYPEQVARATRRQKMINIPIVVLLNRQSASASEVFAGALKDNGRAVVVGTRSFGKGLTQSVIDLPSGAGQLKLTESYYYGPSGRMINREDGASEWGVDPTPGFFVPMTDSAYIAMLNARADADVIRQDGDEDPLAYEEGESTRQWLLRVYEDVQLASALEALELRFEDDEWVGVGDEEDTFAAQRESLVQIRRTRNRLLRELERIDETITALSSDVPEDEADAQSLIPDAVALQDGHLEIFDAEGNLVSTLRITGEGLERWLEDAPVESQESATPEQE